jgi:uncharacterized membrane protein YhhN
MPDAMTATVALLLTLTAVIAVADWIAVASGRRRLEYAAKPLTMVGLIATVLAYDTDQSAVRVFVVAALALSLLGDVLLMLPDELFVPGLAAFLLAHVAYVVAMLVLGALSGGLLIGLVGVAIAAAVIGRPIVQGAMRHDPDLRIPVLAYLGVISLMVATAAGTGVAVALAGALLFYGSDAVLGWSRFVADFERSRVVVIVSYHLGQVLLALGLL